MQGTMPGARRRGRPRTAWMDIKTRTGLSVEESIRMTEDRDKCRKHGCRTAGREGGGKGNEKTKGMRKAREAEGEREGRGVEGICRTNIKLLPTCLSCDFTGWYNFGKIIKIVAARCHILKLGCAKFDFGCGSAPDPLRELTALPQTP